MDDWIPQVVSFLRDLEVNAGCVSGFVVNRMIEVVSEVNHQVPQAFKPTIGLGPDGMLGSTWDSPNLHLNIEVFPDGHLEFFHENLKTGHMWSIDHADNLYPEVFRILEQVIEDKNGSQGS
jgi:hypothetical protein